CCSSAPRHAAFSASYFRSSIGALERIARRERSIWIVELERAVRIGTLLDELGDSPTVTGSVNREAHRLRGLQLGVGRDAEPSQPAIANARIRRRGELDDEAAGRANE